jgi:hypothetical protein
MSAYEVTVQPHCSSLCLSIVCSGVRRSTLMYDGMYVSAQAHNTSPVNRGRTDPRNPTPPKTTHAHTPSGVTSSSVEQKCSMDGWSGSSLSKFLLPNAPCNSRCKVRRRCTIFIEVACGSREVGPRLMQCGIWRVCKRRMGMAIYTEG